uniref:AlNc14C380G11209 protein n=1 Tax=Albugo laibachii Nc14 TaxID=890382 RepID=F0WYE8_9STRA|nr:AlNc14C380G11209 [Albugo laibachii Nc14]|eukprot:CCA26502.1 AlNc14C380G11209 [Albugo laibachii Nc14]
MKSWNPGNYHKQVQKHPHQAVMDIAILCVKLLRSGGNHTNMGVFIGLDPFGKE